MKRTALVVVLLIGAAGGCGRDDGSPPRPVAVAAKVIPAYITGSDAQKLQMIEVRPVVGDAVPSDPVTSVDEIRCQVAIAELPRGTVLSKKMFRAPAEVGVSLPPGIDGCT